MKNYKYISKENFVKICKSLTELQKRNRDLYKLRVDLLDFTDDYCVIITTLIEEIYGKSKTELVLDWIYCAWEGKIYEKDGAIPPIPAILMLWKSHFYL